MYRHMIVLVSVTTLLSSCSKDSTKQSVTPNFQELVRSTEQNIETSSPVESNTREILVKNKPIPRLVIPTYNFGANSNEEEPSMNAGIHKQQSKPEELELAPSTESQVEQYCEHIRKTNNLTALTIHKFLAEARKTAKQIKKPNLQADAQNKVRQIVERFASDELGWQSIAGRKKIQDLTLDLCSEQYSPLFQANSDE